MKKILAYLLIVIAVLIASYLYYDIRNLKQSLAESIDHQLSLEAWQRADSLFFSGEEQAARSAWQEQAGQANSLEAVKARLAFLEQAQIDEQRYIAAIDSLNGALAFSSQAARADKAAISNLEQRLRRTGTRLQNLSDSIGSLSFHYAKEINSREGLAALQAERLQAQEATIAALEQEAQSKQILKFKSPAGVDIAYIGEVKDGKAHGHGIGIWANGTAYTGQWQEGKKHGKGIYEYPEGEKFEGDFVKDKRQGFGTYVWKNGDRYEGYWELDLRHGEGFITNNKGEIVRGGIWEKDVLVQKQKTNGASQK